MARRLRATIRESDFVARLGGDEFVVLASEVQRPEDALSIAGKIRLAFSKPVTILGQEITVTPSIGISLYPDDGEDSQILLRNADAALYQAKSEGRNNVQFYSRT